MSAVSAPPVKAPPKFEMNALYAQVLDSISDLVLVKGPKSRILWANRAFLEYYGMTIEALRGIIDAPFSEPDHTQQYVKDDARVFETGEVLDIPAEPVTRHDGQIRYFHTVKTPLLGENGEVLMTVGVSRDITEKLAAISERKRQERIIDEQRQRMITTSKFSALGEMSGAIAHEINNPLTVIHGRAAQLREAAEDGELTPSLVIDIAARIEKTALRISKIIKALRSFSRDGARDPFDIALVSDLIEDTIEFSRERFERHGIKLIIDDFDPTLTVDCQAVPISQVLLNLLNNADDAVLELPEKWVRLALREVDDHLYITITDSGRGIPPDLREKIMRPFFTTKGVGLGTGIGLSVSKGIIENHQGTLTLDTTCAHTSFVIKLPVRQSAEPVPVAEPALVLTEV